MRALSAASFALFVAACGGGGGGSSIPHVQPSSPETGSSNPVSGFAVSPASSAASPLVISRSSPTTISFPAAAGGNLSISQNGGCVQIGLNGFETSGTQTAQLSANANAPANCTGTVTVSEGAQTATAYVSVP